MTETTAAPDRIHFASCNSQHYEQKLWPHIVARHPAAFLWAGDAIYGDDVYETIPKEDQSTMRTPRALSWTKLQSVPGSGRKRVQEATPKILHDLYAQQLEHPGYQALIGGDSEKDEEHSVVVMGTFDDHDYGRNNGDRTYRYRRESAEAHIDFVAKSNGWTSDPHHWAVMKQRASDGKGVYGVKVIDFHRPKGQQLLTDEEAGLELGTKELTQPLSNRSVAIFLLDCRSNKTPWSGRKLKSELDYQGDFLGEEQWAWFEEAIGRSTATVNIVVQGLQVHPERYFDGHLIENWSRFPMAQHRLYQAVLKGNVQVPILVSGDVHMAEVMRRDCRRVSKTARNDGGLQADSTGRVLLEVTSSGMTHSWGSDENWISESSLIKIAYMSAVHSLHMSGSWTDLVTLERDEVQEGARSGIQYTLDKNFGEFEFDWENRKVLLRILGQDPAAAPFLSTRWDFDTLSGRTPANETGLVRLSDYGKVFSELASHDLAEDGDWICVNYRGYPTEGLQLFGFVSSIAVMLSVASFPFMLPALLACFMVRRRARKKSKVVYPQ